MPKIRSEWIGARDWKIRQNRGPQPVARFKVWANPRKRSTSPFFWVTVWKTLQQARKRMRALQMDPNDLIISSAMGACFGWKITSYKNPAKEGPGTVLPEMGEIVLSLNWIRVGIIAHECLHAVHRITERMEEEGRLHPSETHEEERCIIHGDMVMQVVRGYQRYQP